MLILYEKVPFSNVCVFDENDELFLTVSDWVVDKTAPNSMRSDTHTCFDRRN